MNLRTSFPHYLSWQEAVASMVELLSAASPRSLSLFAPRVLSLLVRRLFGPASAASKSVSYFLNCPSPGSIKMVYEKISVARIFYIKLHKNALFEIKKNVKEYLED